jgi:aspartyl-tRNA(Asn)/glutamyl-tRNA(Gln) amidotransferase subunit A
MAAIPEDVFFATTREINAKLKAHDFKAVELARAFCDRLERLGPRYNALALSLRDHAVKAAHEVDGDLKRERYRGMLQGIPFGAKDLLSVAKKPTAWGSKAYAGQVFDYTATVLQKLDKSGALLTGKLSMMELAGGPTCRYPSASMHGAGLNPWDVSRWSGGSSSGSAAAVAAGLVTFAIGSETKGSILSPSAFCGVTGLRPTYGLVSRYGAMPLAWTLDKIGPICRSAEDCGHVLQAIAGGDGKDPASAGKSFYYTPEYARAVKEVVIGFVPADFQDAPEPSARPVFQRAFEEIKALGVQVKEVKLPDFPYLAIVDTILSTEAASVFEDLITSGKVNELSDVKQIAGFKAGFEIPAREYLRAMRLRTLARSAFRELLAGVDMLISPVHYGPAPKVSEPVDGPAVKPPSILIAAGNLAGLPALSLPCGFADNLPVGMQLLGGAWSENMLLSIGSQYQSRTDWHRRRPDGGAAKPSDP